MIVAALASDVELLVLDEPCRHLSRDYQSRVRDLFLALADECGVQIVFVTHSDEMACGKVVDL
jgi:ABC-type cobalamin/Fe3+-siderophores transport system ATPase subunit